MKEPLTDEVLNGTVEVFDFSHQGVRAWVVEKFECYKGGGCSFRCNGALVVLSPQVPWCFTEKKA